MLLRARPASRRSSRGGGPATTLPRSRPLLTLALLAAVLLLCSSAFTTSSSSSSSSPSSSSSSSSSSLGGRQPGAAALQHGGRALLQQASDGGGGSYADTACYPNSGVLHPAAVQRYAAALLGDARLAVTGARFSGACQALGLASLSPPHAFAALFPSGLVLSTGDAAAAVGDAQDGWRPLSTDLQAAGDARIGAHTRDAAVLELDLSVSPAASGGGELVLSYLWGSEELETSAPNPDALAISIAPRGGGGGGGADAADLAVLPGGGKLQPPAAAGEDAGVQLFSNGDGRYRTALNGFTQVLPSQGYAVQPGGSYTLRLAVADANHGLIDSVLMLPAGSLRLVAAPTAAPGGPYSVAPHGKLSLDGAKSASPSGAAILAYAWTITPAGGGAGAGAPIFADGPAPGLAAPPAGAYDVTLEVWDADGGYAAASTPLSVDAANVRDWWSTTPGFAAPPVPAAPRPAAVLAVNGARGDAALARARSDGPAVVDLDGSASADARGSKLAYFWRVAQTQPTARPVELLTSYAQPARLVQELEPGSYVVSLEVLGPGGAASRQVALTVAANARPTAVAGGPYTAQVGRPLIVDGGGSSDPDGDPLAFSWSLSRGGALIGNFSGPALSVTLNRAGTYALRLTVRDDRGGEATASTEITALHELPAPPPLPAASQPGRSAAALPQPPAEAPPPPPPRPVPVPGARVRAAGLPGLPAEPAALGGGGAAYGGYPAGGQGYLQAALAPQLPQAQQSPQDPPQQQQVSPEQAAAEAQAAYMQKQALLMQQRAQEQQQLQAQLLQAQQQAAQLQQQQQQLEQQQAAAATAALPTPAAPSAALPAGAAGGPSQQQPGPAMCLYSRQAGATPLSAQLNPTAETFIAPCAANDPAAAAGVAGAPPAAGGAPATAPAAGGAPAAVPAAGGAPDEAAAAAAAAAPAPAPLPVPAPAPAPAQALDEAQGRSTAVISSPEPFVRAIGAATQVFLDAAGSSPAAGRSLVAYRWTVARRPDGVSIATLDGARAPVWLAPGEYVARLRVTDTAGQTADAPPRDFALGEASATQASISGPDGFVELPGGEGSASVQLAAAGSTAGPGRSVVSYAWQVLRLPDGAVVATASGPAPAVTLPGGSYSVQLTVLDSAGTSASASKAVAVGGRGSDGATAVIAWPPLVVAAAGAGVPTKVALDASGSSAGAAGSSLAQFVWAVLSLPDRRPVANATGRLATVELAAGRYQVGLLVVDGAGRTATARKAISIGGGGGGGGSDASASDGSAAGAGGSSVASSTASGNRPPVVPRALNFTAAAGSSLSIAGVADPDGDAVELSWSLQDQASGQTVSGEGSEVSLDGVSPGQHLLLITADDGRGGEASGTARVTVTAAMPAAGGAGKQQRPAGAATADQQAAAERAAAAKAAAAKAAAIAPVFGGSLPRPRKLPVLVLPQGAVLELDAAAFHLTPAGQAAESFAWQLQQRGTGQQVAAVNGRTGRFALASLEALNIRLLATDAEGGQHASTGSVRVQEAAAVGPDGGGAVADAAAGIRGRCGPFRARQYEVAALSCPELETGAARDALHWAWRVTPVARLSGAGGGREASMQLATGRAPSFAGLAPGLYRAELALGLGGPPSSANTAYYLATTLQVAPTRSLSLALPPAPVCAGQAVAVQAPALALAPGAAPPAFSWRAQPAGSGDALQGSGRAFGFTPAPGAAQYEVTLEAALPDGARLTGRGSVRVKPCITCKAERVALRLPDGACQASAAQAALLLAGPVPSGVQLRWADGAATTPGVRNATVLARAASGGSGGGAAAAEVSNCTALVEFRDQQPPTVARRHARGACLAPADGRWACWAAQDLVAVSDNCPRQQLALRLACTRGRGDCKVLPDGRACVRAAAAGQVAELTVAARDAAGNVAEPVEVLVHVRASAAAAAAQGLDDCRAPDLAALPAPSVAAATAASPSKRRAPKARGGQGQHRKAVRRHAAAGDEPPEEA